MDGQATWLVQLAKAMADQTRVQILLLLEQGRGCCQLPCCALPAANEPRHGLCNCELQALLGLSQSKVSYHIKLLREAGLVVEQPVGKWSYVDLTPQARSLFVTLLDWYKGGNS